MEERDPQLERRPRPRRKAPPKNSPAPPRGEEPIPEEPKVPATISSQDLRRPAETAKPWAPEAGLSARTESRRLDKRDRREGPGERASDFDRLAAENPRMAVLGAVLLGLAAGFLLGRFADND